MLRLRTLTILVALAAFLAGLAGRAGAAGKVEVYINNKPFKGGVSGPANDLLLEAEPYFKVTGSDFKYDPETGTATVDGTAVTVTMVGGAPYIRAKEMVSMVGGRYNANAALGTVDIYAFDPVEAARKAWARIMSQPMILSEDDFAIMTTLTKGILTKELGMDLDFDVKMLLVSAEDMKAATGSDNYATYTSWSTRPGAGSGIANAQVLVRRGLPPQITITYLARAWSHLWATRLGLAANDDLLKGFDMWVAWHLLRTLGLDLPPSAVASSELGQRESQGARQEFLRLAEMELTGGSAGAAGVVNSIRNLKKR